MELSYEVLFQLLKEGISEYKEGKRRIMTSSSPATPAG
jgi:hypothetical protein